MCEIQIGSIRTETFGKGWLPGSEDFTEKFRECLGLLKRIFILSILLQTQDLDDAAIDQEPIDAGHGRVLCRWLADCRELAHEHEALNFVEIGTFIANSLKATNHRFDQLVTMPEFTYLPNRRKWQRSHQLTEIAMVEILKSLPLKLLCDMAIRWSDYCSQYPPADLLEQLGLTPRTVVELSDERLIELDLIDRLEAERVDGINVFWQFLQSEKIGLAIVEGVLALERVAKADAEAERHDCGDGNEVVDSVPICGIATQKKG
jgi:hypothetical protein